MVAKVWLAKNWASRKIKSAIFSASIAGPKPIIGSKPNAPNNISGGISGKTKRLANGATKLNVPKCRPINGAVKTIAPNVGAIMPHHQ